MPSRPQHKITQFKALTRDIILYRDPSRIILLGMSNDLESLIFKGGELLPLNTKALARWNKIKDKAHFNHNTCKLLHNNSVVFLKWRLTLYVDTLYEMFSNSSAVVVYHVSVLERMMPQSHPDLPMYITILNSFLFATLKKTVICNKFGTKITFKFVNVAPQFYGVKKQSNLFRFAEVEKGEMVHRTAEAYRNLFSDIRAQVLAHVYK